MYIQASIKNNWKPQIKAAIHANHRLGHKSYTTTTKQLKKYIPKPILPVASSPSLSEINPERKPHSVAPTPIEIFVIPVILSIMSLGVS